MTVPSEMASSRAMSLLGVPFQGAPQHLELPIGQFAQGRWGAGRRISRPLCGAQHLGRQVHPAGQDQLQGTQHDLWFGRLGHIARRAPGDGRADDAGIFFAGHHYPWAGRKSQLDGVQRQFALDAGHVPVQEDQVEAQFMHVRSSGAPIRLADVDRRKYLTQHQPQAPAEQGMVINQKDTHIRPDRRNGEVLEEAAPV
ncbi:MAG: hypothetical protein IPK05_10475 [Comamonadaceae bacterium]|nr:hypothetical protein [Comamonadaceae bacterium]